MTPTEINQDFDQRLIACKSIPLRLRSRMADFFNSLMTADRLVLLNEIRVGTETEPAFIKIMTSAMSSSRYTIRKAVKEKSNPLEPGVETTRLLQQLRELPLSSENESTCTTDEFGTKRWRNGKSELHNEQGPAVVYNNGYKGWSLDGEEMSEEKWESTLLWRQAAGRVIRPGQDVQPLLYSLLTGRRPSRGPEPQDFPRMNVHDEVEIDRSKIPDVDYSSLEEMLATLFFGPPKISEDQDEQDDEQDDEQAKKTEEWRARARRAVEEQNINAELVQEILGRTLGQASTLNRFFQDQLDARVRDLSKQAKDLAEGPTGMTHEQRLQGLEGAVSTLENEVYPPISAPEPKRGKLIVIEGIDGAGTTAQAKLTAEWLGAELVCEPRGLLEPMLREYMDPNNPRKVCEEEMAVLFTASMVLNKHGIEEHLAAGRNVVSDRHSLSTLVYQGDQLAGRAKDHIRWLSKMSHTPNCTFLLDVGTEIAFKRIADRKSLDMYEGDREKQSRLRKAYKKEARSSILKGFIIDGSKPIDEVQRNIRSRLRCIGIETRHQPEAEEPKVVEIHSHDDLPRNERGNISLQANTSYVLRKDIAFTPEQLKDFFGSCTRHGDLSDA